jgi:hypothetical protein
MKTCETCKAFYCGAAITHNLKRGVCRRYAPKENGWPTVYDSDWCLEYVSKKINLDNQYRGGLRYAEDGGFKPREVKLTKEGEALGNGKV